MIRNRNIQILFFISIAYLSYFVFTQFYPAVDPLCYFVDYKINLFNTSYDLIYEKCQDDKEYFEGISDFSVILNSDYKYQNRPLFLLVNYIIYQLLSVIFQISNIDFQYTFELTYVIFNILFMYICLQILIKLFQIKNLVNIFLIILTLIFSPILKFSLFTVTNQHLTLLCFLLSLFLLQKQDVNNINFWSFILGIIYLANRGFIISALVILYILFMNSKNFKIFLIESLKNLLIFFFPNMIYNLFFSLTKYEIYDVNSYYFGQFIWLRNYLRPFINYFSNLTSRIEPVDYLFYESNWHCTSLSTFYRCYLNDNILTLKYLSSFFICLIVSYFLYKEKYLLSNNLLKYILLIFSFSYIFWSFIGWYPPVRFSIYSFGNLFLLLIIYISTIMNTDIGRYIFLTTTIYYFLTLANWNNEILFFTSNNFIVLSMYLFSLLVDRKGSFNKKATL